MTIVSALCRLMPSPPARVLMRKTGTSHLQVGDDVMNCHNASFRMLSIGYTSIRMDWVQR